MNLYRIIFIIVTTLIITACKKETPESCLPPPSQQLLIQLKDSTGNFIDFPNDYFIVSDSISSFYIGTMIIFIPANIRVKTVERVGEKDFVIYQKVLISTQTNPSSS